MVIHYDLLWIINSGWSWRVMVIFGMMYCYWFTAPMLFNHDVYIYIFHHVSNNKVPSQGLDRTSLMSNLVFPVGVLQKLLKT